MMRLLLSFTLLFLFIISGCDEGGENRTVSGPDPNGAPVVSTLIASPAVTLPCDTVSLACDVSDPDGDSLTCIWSSSDGVFITSVTGPAAQWLAPGLAGQYTISMIVSDGRLIAVDSLQVEVIPENIPPVITSIQALPDTVIMGESVSLLCSGTDADGDSLQYSWSSSGGEFEGDPSDDSATWSEPDSAGLFKIFVSLSDGEDAVSDSVTVTVNGPPIPANPAHGDIWTAYIGEEYVPLEMIYVEAGTFMMGAKDIEQHADVDEFPRREVTLTTGFWMGKYEVTQRQWIAVTGTNPFHFDGHPNKPAEQVSHNDVLHEFLPPLNELESESPWRLPTEAEWEYVARAGNDTLVFWWGDDVDYSELPEHAWLPSNSGDQTHDVGEKPPNPWGFHDMHGNVWEWMNDWYDINYYQYAPSVDPTGPPTGTGHVRRGGSWQYAPQFHRPANRNRSYPSARYPSFGFRVARDSASE